MAAPIETAYVAVRPDTRGFAQQTKRQVGQQLGTAGAVGAGAGRSALAVGVAFTGVATGILATTAALKAGFAEVMEGQRVMTGTEATIKGTGGVANVTTRQVLGLADSLSELSGVDDELIANGANVLLTFKSIRNEVGKNNDIFTQATQAALDLSLVGGGAFGTMNSASKQLGKALNDPVKGTGALARAGVQFTDAQKKAIKAMVEANNVLGAQKLILAEVTSQIGPQAEAFGGTLPGQLGKLRNAFVELIASGLEPLIPGLSTAAGSLAEFFREMQRGGKAAGVITDSFNIAATALKPLLGALASDGPRIRAVFEDLADLVQQMTPLFKVVAVVIGVTLVVAFKAALFWVERLIDIWKVMAAVIREVVQVIIKGIDLFLGGLSVLTDAASHLPLVGDHFTGISDKINASREVLREFSDDLDDLDGRHARVELEVALTPGSFEERGLGIDVPEPPKAGADASELGPRAIQENRLQQEADIARNTEGTLADDRAALQALIAFYAESRRLAIERGNHGRQFLIAQQQAQNELTRINQGVVDAQRQATEDALDAAADRRAAALAERRATLEANIGIASLSELNVRDDKVAYNAFIGFLRERVRAARAAGAGVRAAVAELKAAQQELKTVIQEAKEAAQDARKAAFDEREDLLQDRLTLAGFTTKESDDERALKELIQFYRKRSRDVKLSAAARRDYLISLRQAQADLRELRKEEEDAAGEKKGTTAFELLQQHAGQFGNIAGNLVNKDQPFKEVSDFLGDQASLLTRGAGFKADIEVSRKEQQRDRQIERLIEALDRNTGARGGQGFDRPEGESGHDSGALPKRGKRWQEAGTARARVEGGV